MLCSVLFAYWSFQTTLFDLASPVSRDAHRVWLAGVSLWDRRINKILERLSSSSNSLSRAF